MSQLCPIQMILPYFYLVRFVKDNQAAIIEELIQLLSFIFRHKVDTQSEVCNFDFFKIISQLVNECGIEFLNQRIIHSIAEFRFTIIDKNLKDEVSRHARTRRLRFASLQPPVQSQKIVLPRPLAFRLLTLGSAAPNDQMKLTCDINN